MAESVTACPACLQPVTFADIGGHGVVLDAVPDPERGQVLAFGGRGKVIDRPEQWKLVRQYGLPLYRRHGTHCPQWWYYRVHHQQQPDTTESTERLDEAILSSGLGLTLLATE